MVEPSSTARLLRATSPSASTEKPVIVIVPMVKSPEPSMLVAPDSAPPMAMVVAPATAPELLTVSALPTESELPDTRPEDVIAPQPTVPKPLTLPLVSKV